MMDYFGLCFQHYGLTLGIILSLFLMSVGQHYPPGVNPQVYQQQPQMHQVPAQQIPQQYQPSPQMHQQPMQAQQQMQHPPQQLHAQPPHAQQPHMDAGHHGAQNPGFHVNLQQEKDHIAEHMDVPIDTSKMTEQELQFHYFKMHDSDNNNKLDGCELIKSLIHWHEQGHHEAAKTGAPPPQEKIFKDEELVGLIDPILSIDDTNNDGFIDYPEFVRAQQKSAAAQTQQKH